MATLIDVDAMFTPYSTNDARYFAFLALAQKLAAVTPPITHMLITDLFDVQFRSDPFYFMAVNPEVFCLTKP